MKTIKWILSRYEKKDELSQLIIDKYKYSINNLTEAIGYEPI